MQEKKSFYECRLNLLSQKYFQIDKTFLLVNKRLNLRVLCTYLIKFLLSHAQLSLDLNSMVENNETNKFIITV